MDDKVYKSCIVPEYDNVHENDHICILKALVQQCDQQMSFDEKNKSLVGKNTALFGR